MANQAPQFVHANGLRFAYLEDGVGPLVLLAHGFPDTAHTWDEVRPVLAAAGYRAVSPFSRGYHPTSIPEHRAYDQLTLGRDLLALIAALGESQAFVVGHDWGATAAYAAASLEPVRVSFLVTIALPHPASLLPYPRVLWGARHMFAFQRKNAAAKVRAHDFAYVDRLLRRWSPAWTVPAAETRAIKEILREPDCLEAALDYYRAVRLQLPSMLRTPIAVPSAVFCGASDPILRPSDYVRARRWYAASYEVVTLPGGHFLHREHPAQFGQELLRVLRARECC